MAENGSVVIKIKGDDNDFKSKLKSLGGAVSTTMKATAAAVGAASAGIAALGTACINAFADYEQLAGGVETLFKDSAELVHSYADNAYKTAGLSANAYMETVTSFSASLLQSLGGDTEAAAKYADQAITDMADNANKMGTGMELIQNAYQGFAKQNYTMLDNLKLGYGGTKEEMQRLLQDAEKLSGIKYDISSFADITEAIHVIQTEMGITGTTAKEASTTIQGSIASMKASWTNLMVGIADETQDFDALLGNFIESIGTVAENLLPRIGVVIEGMGELVAGLTPEIAAALPTLTNELLPELVELGVQAIGSLVQGIQENGDSLAEGALSIVGTLGEGIVELLPMIADTAASLMVSLADGITESLPEMVPAAVETIAALVEKLTANADTILQAGIDIVLALGEGLINALPQLIETIPQIVINIADVINHNATQMLGAALQLIMQLGVGLIQNIPTLLANIPAIIEAIVKAFFAFQWVSLGSNIITAIGNGVKGAGSTLTKAAADISTAFAGKVQELPVQLIQVGKNVVAGLVNGIKSAAPNLLQAAREMSANLLSNVKSLFKIQSPSKVMRDEVGAMLVAGVAQGIKENKSKAVQAAEEMSRELLAAAEQYAEDRKFYNEMTLQEEIDFWEEMKTLNEFSAEELAKIDKKIYSAKKAVLAEEKRLMEEHEAEVKKREQEIQSSADRISGFKGLFDAAESEEVSGKDLIANLESQMDAIERFRDSLTKLQEKGVSGGLLEELSQMGPDAADEIEALNKLSAAKLDEYIAMYKEKQKAAEEIAKQFYSLGSDTVEELQAVGTENVSEGAEDQEPVLEETTELLVETMLKTAESFEKDFVDVGEMMMEGLAEGIKDNARTVINAVVKVIKDSLKKVREMLGIASPSKVMAEIGRYMAQGIDVGWTEQMADVSESIGKSLSDGMENRMTNAYTRMRAAMDDGMYRLSGDIAVQAKGASNYTTNTTNNTEGDFVVNIEKIVNDGKGTVAGMMEEFEFIRRQKALAKGGA